MSPITNLVGTDAPGHRLSMICVGAGRDGTTSVTKLIQEIFDRERRGRRCEHEWNAPSCYANFCDYQETGDERYLEANHAIVAAYPFDALVGNGYAHILPMIAEIWGENVVLVHLVRRDRDAFVKSFATNIQLFPTNHKYYSDSPEATGKRMAAFHFDEASRDEWDAWSLKKKIDWYYDKTHSLIEAHKHLFKTSFTIETEALDRVENRKLLAEALGSDLVPPSVHLNQHMPIESLSVEGRQWVHNYLAHLDVHKLAADDSYAFEHFASVFNHRVRHTLASGDDEAKADMATRIARMKATLVRALDHLETRPGTPPALQPPGEA